MYHLFFINERSLGERLENCRNEIEAVCRKHSLKFRIFTTSSIEDLRETIANLDYFENPVFYAVGGDGSLQSMINAAGVEGKTFQYLPYGSGNNSYITFYNCEFDLEEDILSQNIFKADIGKASGEYFVSTVGFALEAQIGDNFSKFRRIPGSGQLKYLASILYTVFFCAKPINVKITIDGATMEKISSFISVTNGPTVGGRTPISPHSTAFDGKLNAIMAGKLNVFQTMKLFLMIKDGKHLTAPGISQYLFDEISFESKEELIYEIDGEIRRGDSVEIKVLKNALTLKGRAQIKPFPPNERPLVHSNSTG